MAKIGGRVAKGGNMTTDTERHDARNAGDACERYMGRWSRDTARRFLDFGWVRPNGWHG